MPMLSISAALLLVAPAQAAGVNTDFPPWLRGEVVVHYDLDASSGQLTEGGEDVGRMRHMSQVMTYEGAFTVWHGLALVVGMPHWVNENVRFTDAQSMAFEPASNAGTMLGTDGIGSPEPTKGQGVGGAWLGLRGAPMHQEIFGSRGDRVSWILDVGYRFKDQTPFWTYGPRGTRGAGPGAGAFIFKSTVATTHNLTSPYLVTELTRAGRLETSIVDADGNTSDTVMNIRPASSAGITLGAEVKAVEYGTGARLDVDMRTRFGYRSWQDLPSGTYLPSVLDTSEGLSATLSETSYLTLGAGIHWRFIDYLQLDLMGDVGVNTGGRVEHLYPVDMQLGALEWQVQSALRFRIRDTLIEALQQPPAPAAPPPPPPQAG